jgi:hypothetical protein
LTFIVSRLVSAFQYFSFQLFSDRTLPPVFSENARLARALEHPLQTVAERLQTIATFLGRIH